MLPNGKNQGTARSKDNVSILSQGHCKLHEGLYTPIIDKELAGKNCYTCTKKWIVNKKINQ